MTVIIDRSGLSVGAPPVLALHVLVANGKGQPLAHRQPEGRLSGTDPGQHRRPASFPARRGRGQPGRLVGDFMRQARQVTCTGVDRSATDGRLPGAAAPCCAAAAIPLLPCPLWFAAAGAAMPTTNDTVNPTARSMASDLRRSLFLLLEAMLRKSR